MCGVLGVSMCGCPCVVHTLYVCVYAYACVCMNGRIPVCVAAQCMPACVCVFEWLHVYIICGPMPACGLVCMVVCMYVTVDAPGWMCVYA